jgi:spermidine/putrescine transport system substrate-binding protein
VATQNDNKGVSMMNRPLPEDPMVRSLIKAAKGSKVSRRGFLGGTGGAAVTAALWTAAGTSTAALAGCAPSDRLIWMNWDLYLDQDDEGNYPTLDRFTEQTGIEVDYKNVIDDNNTWYGSVREELQLGRYIKADIVTPTEWMCARWVQLGYALPFDEANIPNKANLTAGLQNPDFDPGRKYTLPWQAGFAGLGWNSELTGDLRSVEDLWKPELKGRVVVLSEMRDTMGVIMLSQGTDITKFTADQFYNALDLFSQKVSDGHIANVKGNAYKNDLQDEVALAVIGWSGDITGINYEGDTDKFKFGFPDSGVTLWNDSMMIPIESPRKAEAEALMNYYYDPAVAAEVAAWVNYITPVEGAYDEAIKIDPALAENKLIFPDAETLSKAHVFRTLSNDEETEFQAAFQGVLSQYSTS